MKLLIQIKITIQIAASLSLSTESFLAFKHIKKIIKCKNKESTSLKTFSIFTKVCLKQNVLQI